MKSTKLLGFTINQDATWENHLWGCKEQEVKVPGLICQLNRAVGVIKKLATILPPKQLRVIALGLFQSRLVYALPLVGGLWLPSVYLHKDCNHAMMIKVELLIIQAIQNKMMRTITGTTDQTTSVLLSQTALLSVQQLAFSSTVCLRQRGPKNWPTKMAGGAVCGYSSLKVKWAWT